MNIFNKKNEKFIGLAWEDVTISANNYKIKTYYVYLNSKNEIKIYLDRIVKFGFFELSRDRYLESISLTHQHISTYLKKQPENAVLSKKKNPNN